MHPSSCKPGSNSFTRSGSPIYSTQSSISRSIMDWEGIAVVRMRWQHSNHSYAPRYIQKHTKIQHSTRKFQFNQEFRLIFRYPSFASIFYYTPKVYIRCKSPIIVMRSKLCYTMSWLAQEKVLDKRIWSIPIMMLYHNFFMPYLPPLFSPFCRHIWLDIWLIGPCKNKLHLGIYRLRFRVSLWSVTKSNDL